MNGNEIREVINVFAEENKMFMEVMKTRFFPINQKFKNWIYEGRIGEVRLLQADFGFSVPFDPMNRLLSICLIKINVCSILQVTISNYM